MKSHFLKKEPDSRCVWMSAGVVNYKLCDREYDCEACEFHRVMRGMLSQDAAKPSGQDYSMNDHIAEHEDGRQVLINQYLSNLFAGCQIHLGRYHHTSHLWFKIESDTLVQVGIDNLILKLLEPVEDFVLPEIGNTYHPGQLIAWIIRRNQTIPLHSPLKGKVVEISRPLFQVKQENSTMPDTCLFKLKGQNLRRDVQRLCGSLHGLHNYTHKIDLIRLHMQEAFVRSIPANVGITLADGGNIEAETEKVIGEKAYIKLLEDLFPRK